MEQSNFGMDEDAFDRVAEKMASLDDNERRALIRLFGGLYERRELPSPALCLALREIGSLDDRGIIWLARWFQENVNLWGVVVGDAARERLRPSKRRDAGERPRLLEVYKSKAQL